jgi:hypothetical protein
VDADNSTCGELAAELLAGSAGEGSAADERDVIAVGEAPPLQAARVTLSDAVTETMSVVIESEMRGVRHGDTSVNFEGSVPECPVRPHALGSSSVTTAGSATFPASVTVVVGVDGSGRTYRLEQLAAGTGADVVRIGWTATPGPALRAALDAGVAGATIVIDDAHRLDPAVLTAVLTAVHAQARVLLSRRPTVTGPELADLDAEVAARGAVEILGPLDDDALVQLLGPAEERRLKDIRRRSCGLAAIAASLATTTTACQSPSLVARVQRRIALLDPAAAAVARLLSLGLPLQDHVLASAANLDVEQSATPCGGCVRKASSIRPGRKWCRPWPRSCPLTCLRHSRAFCTTRSPGLSWTSAPMCFRWRGGCAPLACGHPQPLWSTGPRASGCGSTILDRRWAGSMNRSTPGLTRCGWPRCAPKQACCWARPRTSIWFRLVPTRSNGCAGWGDSRRPPWSGGRAADLLTGGGRWAGSGGPSLVTMGRYAEAIECAGATGPLALRRFAEAALAVPHPDAAVPLFIEASEALGRGQVGAVLPDTPQAVAAPVAVLAGDAATAESLLGEAVATGLAGPAGVTRHRLLIAWVRLRTGRFDTAVAELAALGHTASTGRERLLCAAIEAALARRSGDIGRLRHAWSRAERVLARRAVDVLQIELLEELLVAAARLRRASRSAGARGA